MDRIRKSFAQQPMMATLRAELVSAGEGRATIRLPAGELVLQQHGYVHGGAITTIADSAAGYAAMTMVDEGTEVLTIELKTNFLRPAKGELVAEGKVVRAGRQVIVAKADVFAGPERRHVAMLTATIAAVPPPR